MPDEALKDVIDVKRVAEILDWNPQKVYRFTREGRLPVAKRVGHVYLYLEPEIRAYKADLDSTPAEEVA